MNQTDNVMAAKESFQPALSYQLQARRNVKRNRQLESENDVLFEIF